MTFPWKVAGLKAPGQGVAPQPAAPLLWSAAQAQELRLGFRWWNDRPVFVWKCLEWRSIDLIFEYSPGYRLRNPNGIEQKAQLGGAIYMDAGVARGQNLLHHDHTNTSCIAGQGSNRSNRSNRSKSWCFTHLFWRLKPPWFFCWYFMDRWREAIHQLRPRQYVPMKKQLRSRIEAIQEFYQEILVPAPWCPWWCLLV